jgi:hypothetical protein
VEGLIASFVDGGDHVNADEFKPVANRTMEYSHSLPGASETWTTPPHTDPGTGIQQVKSHTHTGSDYYQHVFKFKNEDGSEHWHIHQFNYRSPPPPQ